MVTFNCIVDGGSAANPFRVGAVCHIAAKRDQVIAAKRDQAIAARVTHPMERKKRM